MMPDEAILRTLAHAGGDLAIVEGNRGLFDGMDARGSHSTAQLARLIGCPVILVVDTTKVTRTVAALVLGCHALDPQLDLAGVILNRVGTARQESVIRQAMTVEVGLPVLGSIPRIAKQHLPSRHLGLVTAAEHPKAKAAIERIAEVVGDHVDLDALVNIARRAPALEVPGEPATTAKKPVCRIGVLRDSAFSFYYPANLSALERAGAELTFVSPLAGEDLPAVDLLYAGGGFPEEHAAALSENHDLRETLARRIGEGLPVWAECGGLIYLSRALVRDGVEHPMVGALPIVTEHTARPQGHGYVRARVDRQNPFLPSATQIRGHEFHYTRLVGNNTCDTVLALERGVGVGNQRDGIRATNVVATYTHVHAAGLPDWAPNLVRAAKGEAA
jgi:cobyrinic acid a,c-diamide synthase